TLGTRTWVTTGNTKMNFHNPLLPINPLSELRWRGVDSVVQEINAEFVWERLLLTSSVGTGGISQGVLIDDDFAENNLRGRFSHSRSSVDDDGLFYVNADIGFRLYEETPRRRYYTDIFVGYQYWHEKYTALGLTGFQCIAFVGIVTDICGPLVVSPTIKVITHDYFWHSLRVGERMLIPLYTGLGLKVDTVILPWSSSKLKDVHHLGGISGDLKQNPRFLSEANGGFVVQLDVGLIWSNWRCIPIGVV